MRLTSVDLPTLGRPTTATMGNGTLMVTCGAAIAAPAGQVCTNKLTDVMAGSNVANVPWRIGGADTGVTYSPPDMTISATPAAGTYYKSPSFYISYLGLTDGGKSSVYQIDAVGYGGRLDAVAVVESTYKVTASTKDLGAL